MRQGDHGPAANALYIELSSAPPARTASLDSGTLVDLDEGDRVVGIEVINPGREWPLAEILARFDVRPRDAELLRSVWPDDFPRAGRFPFAVSGRT